MRVIEGLVTAAMVAVQNCEAAGITKTFQDSIKLEDAESNSLGSIEGKTSWVRSGYGANDSLDMVLIFIAKTTPAEEILWTSAEIALVMTKSAETTDSEYLKVRGSTFDAGNTGSALASTVFTVG